MHGAAVLRIVKHNRYSLSSATMHVLRMKDINGRILTKSNEDISSEKSDRNSYMIPVNGVKAWFPQYEVDKITQENRNVFQTLVDKRINDVNKSLGDKLKKLVVRKDSIMAIEVVIDESQEWWDRQDKHTRNRYFLEALNFCNRKFGGEENLIGISVHGDEHANRRHLHIFYVPITSDMRMSAKDLVGNRVDMHKLQESFYHEVSSQFNMPQPDFGSKRKHIKTEVYKQAVEEAKKESLIIKQKAIDDAASIENDAKIKADEILQSAKLEQIAIERRLTEMKHLADSLIREANLSLERAVNNEKMSEDKRKEIEAYCNELSTLLPELISDVQQVKIVNKKRYSALFDAKRRMKELEISRSREFRRNEKELIKLVENRMEKKCLSSTLS